MNGRGVLARTWRAFGEDHCAQMAAAIAYYVLFSFVPLVSLMVAIFGWFARDPQVQQAVLDSIFRTIPLQTGAGDNLVLDAIHGVSSQSGTLTLIGLAGLLWASSGMFGAIRAALNIAWQAPTPRGFLLDRLLDVGAVLGLGVLLVASLVGTTSLHLLQTLSVMHYGTILTGATERFMTLMGLILPAVFSFVAFLLLYRFVPNVRHRLGDVWLGALVATLLFEASKHAFAFYVSHFNQLQAMYGALGGVMLFVLWTYFAATILLIGAELASAGEHVRREAREPAAVGPALAPGSAGT